jgi:hypothetical protein
MQDLHRLERLGSTAALGMWANDTIMAIDRAARGKATGDDRALLQEAAEALKAASEEREKPDGPITGSIAFAERALEVAERLSTGNDEDAALGLLATVSEELGKVLDNQVEAADKTAAFFSAFGRQQLAATQSVLNSRQEAAWTAGPATLSFS